MNDSAREVTNVGVQSVFLPSVVKSSDGSRKDEASGLESLL